MRFREIEKILLADGWTFKKATSSHYTYIYPTKPGKITIPNHPGDLDFRTVRSIRKQAGQPGPANAKGGFSMKLTYPACFYPCEQKEGGYTVEVPDLPGCVSEGESLADAILMATDAASGWVLDEMEDVKPAPPASAPDSVVPDAGGFVSMLVLDMDAYAEKYGDKAVRKNLTIPAWLNTFAEKNHINFSQVLQDSLTAIYQDQNA